MFWRRRLDKGTLIAVVIAAIWCTGSVAPFASSLGGGSTTTALGGQDPALSAMPEGANPSADSGDAIAALAPLLDYDAASLALSDSDPVSAWPNSGSLGSDWDLSNAGASTTKPTYIASDAALGVSAIDCDGGDYLGTPSATSTAINPPFTIGVVFAPQDLSSGTRRTFRFADSGDSRVAALIHDYPETPDQHQALYTGSVGGTAFVSVEQASSIGEWQSWSTSASGALGSGEADADMNAAGLTPLSTSGPGSMSASVLVSLCSISSTSSSSSSDEKIARVVVLSGEKVDELEAAFAATYGSFPQ